MLDKPIMTVFAGTNGSGKSTLTRVLSDELGVIVDPDKIARNICPSNPESVSAKAGRETLKLVRNLIEEGISFSIETTLAGKNAIRQMELAHSKDFLVRMYYVGLSSVDMHIERVAMRVKQGGHNIPEEDIRRRYQRSLDNLVSAVPLCDLLEVFDNSFTFTKVLEVEQGQLKIISEEIPSWSLSFIQKFQKLEYSNFF